MMLEQLPRNDLLNLFLVDHAGCHNKGCEAILRSLEAHVLEHYGPHNLLVASAMPESDREDLADLTNATFIPLRGHSISLDRVMASVCCRLGNRARAARHTYRHLRPYYEWSDAVIEIGGDSVGPYYGGPWLPLELVRLSKEFGKATAIQGCSVGPFDEEYVYNHARDILRTLDLICARDLLSYEYMLAMGLTNVKLVADPAFHLPVEEIPGLDLPGDAPVVGFGVSHGFPIYVGMSGEDYVQKSARLIGEILDRTDAVIALIPHVFYKDSREDDYQTCEEVWRALKSRERVWMPASRRLNAKQIKYVTGRCGMVVGARMHAIIAAISQGIPSVVFTYSVKSKGLFQQVYGHQDYVLDYASISDGRALKVILDVYARREEVRATMAAGVALMKERSMMNGQHVVDMLRQCSKSAPP